jgi:hypothetical protein
MKKKSRFGTKKLIAFTYNRDLEMTMTYPDHNGEDQIYKTIELTNITEMCQDKKYKRMGKPKLNVKLQLNNLGLVDVVEAYAKFEEEVEVEYEEKVRLTKEEIEELEA